MRRLSNAPVGALAIAVAVAIAVLLTACPAAGGSGASSSYICVNGTPSARSDATADGISRCLRCSPIATLEGTSDTIGATCRLTVEVGEAIRVSAATVSQFGVGENSPYDLAAIGNVLYMVGADTDRLYTLNINTTDMTADGTATQVGNLAAGFGVGESIPTGLAALGTTLYMVGQSNNRLYTLNIDPGDGTDDGRAIQVGSTAAGFGIGETFPRGLAAIGATLYMVGQSNAVLYTLNIDRGDLTPDGTAIRVGLSTNFGVGEDSPSGLAAIENTLYMGGVLTDVSYTIDTTDGSATQVGSLGARFGVGERTPTGLAAIEGTLYMVGQSTDTLYALRYQ